MGLNAQHGKCEMRNMRNMKLRIYMAHVLRIRLNE